MKHKIFLSIFTLLFAASAFAGNTVDLSSLTDNYVAQDKDVLTGELVKKIKISIADNATVTLDGVDIQMYSNKDYEFAGITCEGNCGIVLAENSVNKVKGFYISPGIYVPENKTLTISGLGLLDAIGNSGGAGIGGGDGTDCGNIVIQGGTINATGGYGAAGIGGGNKSNCENITISGGIVSATGGTNAAGIGGSEEGTADEIVIVGGTVNATGGFYSAGIGGGLRGTIGSIVITDGITKVSAKKGSDGPYSVGMGHRGSRTGSIKIASCETDGISTGLWNFAGESSTIVFDANGGDGTMAEQTLCRDFEIALNVNTFTREGLYFAGWNTKADGTGEKIADQTRVLNFAENGETKTLYAQWLEAKTVSLASLTGNYVAQNGEVLMGKLGGNYKLSIAKGATVTLDGVTIDGVSNANYKWAGITCLGTCNIVLADNSMNTVKGFYYYYPGIYVPWNYTLTISGSGSLDVSGNGYYAVGIGCSLDDDCGNIIISGGTITATGGQGATGIGGGYYSYVGNITITDGVTKVTAIKGKEAYYSIGRGNQDSKSGTITIGSLVSENDISTSPFIYTGSVYTIVFDANDGSSRTKNQVVNYGYGQSLNANPFTREDFNFVGWNTKADGSGTTYANRAKVKNLAETGKSITLYAQWSNDGRVYLSGLAGDYEAQDGDVLTGVLEGSVNPYKISIAEGATVTLDGVNINGVDNSDYHWAGITCIGDCGIVLADKSKNTVKGFLESRSGIYVPMGRTLTISGTGSLEASSNGEASGIGGGRWLNCGNIVIDGGTITAIGGEKSAGIGGGYNATVGSITITDNVTKVTAIRKNGAPYSVGKGSGGTRTGDITIGTEVRDDIEESPFVHLRLLTVTAKNKTIAYGDEPADDGVEYAGFLSGDDASVLDGKLMFSTDYKQYGNVGEYDITPYGLTSDNYNIVYKSGTLTVEPKNVGDYAAVQVLEDESGIRAEINGKYDGADTVNIDEDIDVKSVVYNRKFTTGEKAYSTIVLPFETSMKNVVGPEMVLRFNGLKEITKNGVTKKAVTMKIVWDSTMVESASEVTLAANTPYMVLMANENFAVNGPVTLKETKDSIVRVGDWEFRGTRQRIEWDAGHEDLGNVYGFSAEKTATTDVGKFVKVAAGAWIRPLRAYMIYAPETAPENVPGNGRPAMSSIAPADMPEELDVVIEGDDAEHTTVIGRINTRTGEFKNVREGRVFDLKGRGVNGKPKAKGVYLKRAK